jgi:uncharacterized damage-inducible protein DinB
MNFENKTLERLYRSFKWARNNSLQILEAAQSRDILEHQPKGRGQHTILYQFQCLATTTDRYYRKLTNHSDQRFGVLIRGGSVQKADIAEDDLKIVLKQQMIDLEGALRHFSDNDFEINVQTIQSIINHEYLHQGQLIVMLRELEVDLPERFRTAFDL